MLVLLSATVFPVTGLLPTNAGFANQTKQIQYSNTGVTGPNDIWPMFRHDAANSGCTDNFAPNTNHIAWKKHIDVDIGEATPILYADKLYFSTGWYYKGAPKMTDLFNQTPPSPSEILQELLEHPSDASQGLFCLDADTGEELWNKSLEYPSNPAVVDDKLYVTAIDFYEYNTVLYCFDAKTGEPVWNRSVDGLVLSPTIVADDNIYLNCLDLYSYTSSIKRYDLSGNLLWNHPFEGYEVSWFSAPAVSGEYVYCITMDLYTYYTGNLYCLYVDTGLIKWSQPISTLGFLMYFQAASPACFDGNVYVLEFDLYSYGGYLKCFDGATGTIEWTYNLGVSIALGTPAVCEDGVYISAFDLYGYSNRLYRFDPTNGTLLWTVSLPYASYFGFGSSPICSEDKILLAPASFYGYSMELYCFEKENGSIAWNFTLDSIMLGTPSIGENRAYAADYEGNIYMFEDVLKIQNVLGGLFGINAIIQNSGNTSLTNIAWNISVSGGLLGMVNRTRSGTIQELRAGGSRIIRLIPVIGLGKIEVVVKATMPGMNTIKKANQGFVLGSVCIMLS